MAKAIAYEYAMEQVPPNIEVRSARDEDSAAAEYLEKIVNKWARKGWEFYRVDTIGVKFAPGCLGMLLGQRESLRTYYVITFRREIP